MKKILGLMRRCIKDFKMIEDGDRIGVGLSGGKDSMLLLYALKSYQHYSPEKFQLEAFTIDLGFEGFDSQAIGDFCASLDIPFNLRETDIKEIVFDVRKEKNPCSLCANMRRGALHNALVDRGFNKLALGHHRDDAVETLFMSMFYEGRMKTIPTSSYLTRKEIHVIRPFLYLPEDSIKQAIIKNNIPIVKNPCLQDKASKRKEVGHLLEDIYKQVPGAREKIFTALKNEEEFKLWF